jgi:hypothetical protein
MDLTNEEKGRKDYQKIFKQKTGSSKGYTPIEMKLGKADNSVEVKLEKKQKTDSSESQFLPSKLSNQVQSLMKFIYDKDLMTKSVTDVGYDVNKLPLG